MASIVTITSAVDRLECAAGEQAAHSFTVTNVTTGPLRVAVKVVAEAPADTPWFVVEGSAESALDPNTTEVVGVRLQPPADAPAGEYLFHRSRSAAFLKSPLPPRGCRKR